MGWVLIIEVHLVLSKVKRHPPPFCLFRLPAEAKRRQRWNVVTTARRASEASNRQRGSRLISVRKCRGRSKQRAESNGTLSFLD